MEVVALWTGRHAAALRVAYRLSMEAFASKLGVAVRTVANWDANPETVPTPAYQAVLDTALEQAPDTVRARLFLLLDGHSLPPEPSTAAAGDRRAQDIGAISAFRLADLRVGGGHLYPAIVQYLQQTVAPGLVGGGQAPAIPGTFTAAAALTEMAGWMAHDGGQDEIAAGHFDQSLALARAGDDRQVKAHVLGSISHLRGRARQHDLAIAAALAGQEALVGGPRVPGLEARLYAMQARGEAGCGRAQECERLLGLAETTLEARADCERSPWVGAFDEAALATEASRCRRLAGDLAGAGAMAGRVLVLRSPARARSHALAQLTVAVARAADGECAGACEAGAAALEATHGLGSYVILEQLQELAKMLQPYKTSREVRAFGQHLGDELRERMVLFRSLQAGTAGGAP